MRMGVMVTLAALCAAAAAFGTPQHKGRAFDHAFVIVLENHDESSLYGGQMPYLASLVRRYAFAPSYYAVAHPSEPNYIALISGSTWGVSDDDPGNTVDRPNVADQLQARHLTWDGYMESLPRTGDVTDAEYPASAPLYVKKHDPFALFPHTAPQGIKPLAALRGDLRSGKVGNFALVVPNLCHDLHGGPQCPDDRSLEKSADAFLREWVGAIISSQVWKTSRVAIFVVTDEDDSGGDNKVGAAVVTNAGRAHGFVSARAYNHYSLLATLEWNWGLPYLGHAARARRMTAFFPLRSK